MVGEKKGISRRAQKLILKTYNKFIELCNRGATKMAVAPRLISHPFLKSLESVPYFLAHYKEIKDLYTPAEILDTRITLNFAQLATIKNVDSVTFNSLYEYRLYFLSDHSCTIIYRERTANLAWRYLPVPTEAYESGIYKITADARDLCLLTFSGQIYLFINGHWTRQWGRKLGTGSGLILAANVFDPLAFSYLSPLEHSYVTTANGKHALGVGVRSLYQLLMSSDARYINTFAQKMIYFRNNPYLLDYSGQRIVMYDPWIDQYVQFSSPNKGTTRLINIAASSSCLLAMDVDGNIWTRRIDFDLLGCDPMVIYSSYGRRGRKLPCEPWIGHSNLFHSFPYASDIKVTGNMSIVPTKGSYSENFILSIEGTLNYKAVIFKKHIKQKHWTYRSHPNYINKYNFIVSTLVSEDQQEYELVPVSRVMTQSLVYDQYFGYVRNNIESQSQFFSSLELTSVNPYDGELVLRCVTKDYIRLDLKFHFIDGFHRKNINDEPGSIWEFKGNAAIEIINSNLLPSTPLIKQLLKDFKYVSSAGNALMERNDFRYLRFVKGTGDSLVRVDIPLYFENTKSFFSFALVKQYRLNIQSVIPVPSILVVDSAEELNPIEPLRQPQLCLWSAPESHRAISPFVSESFDDLQGAIRI